MVSNVPTPRMSGLAAFRKSNVQAIAQKEDISEYMATDANEENIKTDRKHH